MRLLYLALPFEAIFEDGLIHADICLMFDLLADIADLNHNCVVRKCEKNAYALHLFYSFTPLKSLLSIQNK